MLSPLSITHLLFLITPLTAGQPPVVVAENDDPPMVESFLVEGRLAEGEAALLVRLEEATDDDQARFSLGVVQFLRAVESRMQAFHRHGLRLGTPQFILPVTNLPVPPNPNPQPLSYDNLRAMFQAWIDDLAEVEATLAQLSDQEVKLPLHVGRIRLDFDADGKCTEAETLWKVYTQYNRRARDIDAETAEAFVISFDRGDAEWLRGYCHLLQAFSEMLLAHDFHEMFDRTGHVFFLGAKTPYTFLRKTAKSGSMNFGEISDLIAAIHLIRFPVAEPERLMKALNHLEQMVDLSRVTWKWILMESDDDHEWIPNPSQGTVMPGGSVTQEMVDAWFTALDEFDALLRGEKLVPFWRGTDNRLGVNFRRVFTEPQEFDLVLWFQGTAATPYLEQGELTNPETWSRLNRIFRGEFIGFAIWFN